MSYMEPKPVNADLSARAVVDSNEVEWLASPEDGVERRPLERDGGEVARATSIVRYAANSQFSEHTHGGGEEFFVLSGTFCDETGEFPAGSYVRNPPGSSHKPFSREGCTILVKLRQMREDDAERVVVDTNAAEWQAGRAPGHHVMPLFEGANERVVLEKLDAGSAVPDYDAEGGEELFVLAGSFHDADGTYAKGVWIRNPPGARRGWQSEEGCLLWVKRGHLPTA